MQPGSGQPARWARRAGAGLQAIQHRVQRQLGIQSRQSFTHLSEEEFVAMLETERASEHMIQQELVGFRRLKEEYNTRLERVTQRRTKRVNREVTDPTLQVHVEANRRRQQAPAVGGIDEDEA